MKILNYWLTENDRRRVLLSLSYFSRFFPMVQATIQADAGQDQPLVLPKAIAACKTRAKKRNYMEMLKRSRQGHSVIYPSL